MISSWAYILIGNNGTGKTTFQKEIIQYLCGVEEIQRLQINKVFPIRHPDAPEDFKSLFAMNRSFQEKKKGMVILDTGIIIDHLRLAKNSQNSILIRIVKQKPKETLALSIISVQELYEGQSTQDEDKEQALLATISPLRILPYTYEVAELAGKIARDLKQSIELADAAIAATAITNGCQLLTLNKKDFANIKNLDFETV